MTDSSLFDQMHGRVVTGEFAPGQRLRAERLRADYGVSASTMRETLFRLSTLGLVEFQEQRGFRLPEQSDALQHDLTQFRILLECQGACLSIRLGGIEWEARLSAAHHKLSHIETSVRRGTPSPDLLTVWTRAELEFHQTLIDACESDILKHSHSVTYHRFRQQLITTDREFEYVPENIQQHQGILDAALGKDEDLTCARIRDHLSRNLIRPLTRKSQAIV